MKGVFIAVSLLVFSAIAIIVHFGEIAADQGVRAVDETRDRNVPALRLLERMRFGVTRLVSSASELVVIELLKDPSGSAFEEEAQLKEAVEQYRTALAELSVLRDGGAHRVFPADDELFRDVLDRLEQQAWRLVALAGTRASADELSAAKEFFEDLEVEALTLIGRTLEDAQEAADRNFAATKVDLRTAQYRMNMIAAAAVLVLIVYAGAVWATLRRESKARMTAEAALTRMTAEIDLRKATETRLAAHRKMEALGTLIGGIAHSVNNFLVPVVTLGKLMLRSMPADDERREDVARIHQAGEKAANLMREVLTFARSGRGTTGVCDLAEAVERTVAVARAAMPPTVDLTADIHGGGFLVGKDEAEIDAVLLNLIGNAADALADQGGRIAVGLRMVDVRDGLFDGQPVRIPDGSCACLSVVDDGVGIDAAAMAHIFDPFFTTKPVGMGTGLGLSVVYGTVTRMGGDVAVRSRRGEGAAFHLLMPLTVAAATIAATDD